MKVIVTGGAGFIGSCLIKKLNYEGIDDITAVDNIFDPSKCRNLEGKRIKAYIHKDELLRLIKKNSIEADLVLHMGACADTTETDTSYLKQNNYEYSKKLAVWALAKNIRFIYASSAATYGDGENGYSDRNENTLRLQPLNAYGRSKHLFDLWVIHNKLDEKLTGFKFFNVFGPNEFHKGEMKSLIAKVFNDVTACRSLKLFKSYRKEYSDGEQKRDFIYIKDVMEIVYYFITHIDKTGIFNVGTGYARTWNDVAYSLFLAVKKKPEIEYIEMPEIIRNKYQYFTQADISKLREAGCLHQCMSLENAIKDYSVYLSEGKYL